MGCRYLVNRLFCKFSAVVEPYERPGASVVATIDGNRRSVRGSAAMDLSDANYRFPHQLSLVGDIKPPVVMGNRQSIQSIGIVVADTFSIYCGRDA